MDSRDHSSPLVPTAKRLFGRRKGRPLHVRKARLVEELLPRLRIDLAEGAALDPAALFGDGASPLWLEIGFGGGEHLAAQAAQNPATRFIGCEPFLNGVASLLDHLERGNITNVRVFDNDARMILNALPPASLDRCFVLFADPWPKKRHAERRFIGSENLDRLAQVLKSGAILRLASDHTVLVDWMREAADAHPAFACVHASIEPPADWVQTRYQEKAIAAGRQPFFMDYRRL